MKIWLRSLIISVVVIGTLLAASSMSRAVSEQQSLDYASEVKLFRDVVNNIRYFYFTESDPQKLIYSAIRGMLTELDPHTSFMTADERKRLDAITSGKFGGIGFEVDLTPEDNRITVVTPIEGTPAERGGLRPRDKILKIDGKPTDGMSLNDAINQMRGEPGTKVTLTVLHLGDNTPRDLTFTREIIVTHSVRNTYMLNDHIGYVRLTDWTETSAKDLDKALKDLEKQGMKKLILDIRSNQGGLLTSSVQVANMFLEGQKLIVYTQGRLGESARFNYKSDGKGQYTKLPFVVLVDGYSASASEIFAGAMRDYGRAKIMGQKTYGKASVQNLFDLVEVGKNDTSPALKLTVAHYYTPNGNDIHGQGIKPDIELANAKYPLIIDKLFYDDFYRRFAEYIIDKTHAKSPDSLPADAALLSDFKSYVREQNFRFYPEAYEETLPDKGIAFVEQQIDKNQETVLRITRREVIRILVNDEASMKYWRDQDPWIDAAIKELG